MFGGLYFCWKASNLLNSCSAVPDLIKHVFAMMCLTCSTLASFSIASQSSTCSSLVSSQSSRPVIGVAIVILPVSRGRGRVSPRCRTHRMVILSARVTSVNRSGQSFFKFFLGGALRLLAVARVARLLDGGQGRRAPG